MTRSDHTPSSPASSPSPAGGVREALEQLILLRVKALETPPRSAKKDFAIEELRFVLGRIAALSSPATGSGVREALEALRAFIEEQRDFVDRNDSDMLIIQRAEFNRNVGRLNRIARALSSPATGEVVEAEIRRAASALLNNLWIGSYTGKLSFEENWAEFERKHPGVKWLHEALKAPTLNPAPGHGEGGL